MNVDKLEQNQPDQPKPAYSPDTKMRVAAKSAHPRDFMLSFGDMVIPVYSADIHFGVDEFPTITATVKLDQADIELLQKNTELVIHDPRREYDRRAPLERLADYIGAHEADTSAGARIQKLVNDELQKLEAGDAS